MKCLLEVCLIAAVLVGVPFVAAQTPEEIPMQRGISVEMPATANAVAVPEADKENAPVVTIVRDGSIWSGVDKIEIDALEQRIKSMMSERRDKELYIKADSRVPYAKVIQVLDAARVTGVVRITLLTAQRDAGDTSRIVVPKGLEMQVVGADPSGQN